MYEKKSKKEIEAFQKQEMRKIIDAVNAFAKADTVEEQRIQTQAIQSAAIKVEVTYQGLMHTDWD